MGTVAPHVRLLGTGHLVQGANHQVHGPRRFEHSAAGAMGGYKFAFAWLVLAGCTPGIGPSAPVSQLQPHALADAVDGHLGGDQDSGDSASCPSQPACVCCPHATANLLSGSKAVASGASSRSPCGRKIVNCIWSHLGVVLNDTGNCSVSLPQGATVGDLNLVVTDDMGTPSCTVERYHAEFLNVPGSSAVWSISAYCTSAGVACLEPGHFGVVELAKPSCPASATPLLVAAGQVPLAEGITLEAGDPTGPIPLPNAEIRLVGQGGPDFQIALTRSPKSEHRFGVIWRPIKDGAPPQAGAYPFIVFTQLEGKSLVKLVDPVEISVAVPAGHAWLLGELTMAGCDSNVRFRPCVMDGNQAVFVTQPPAPFVPCVQPIPAN